MQHRFYAFNCCLTAGAALYAWAHPAPDHSCKSASAHFTSDGNDSAKFTNPISCARAVAFKARNNFRMSSLLSGGRRDKGGGCPMVKCSVSTLSRYGRNFVRMNSVLHLVFCITSGTGNPLMMSSMYMITKSKQSVVPPSW